MEHTGDKFCKWRCVLAATFLWNGQRWGEGGAATGEMASKYGRIKKVLESQKMEDTGK